MTNSNKLADALRAILKMLREHPAMQGREYVGLGIAANNALREYDAALAEHDAQPAPATISEERKQRLCALERCIQGREADANRMDGETGDPWASLGYREDTAQLVILHKQLSQPAPAADGAGELVPKSERHTDGSFRITLTVAGVKFTSEAFDNPRIHGVATSEVKAAIAALRQPAPDAVLESARGLAAEYRRECSSKGCSYTSGFADAIEYIASQQESRNAD